MKRLSKKVLDEIRRDDITKNIKVKSNVIKNKIRLKNKKFLSSLISNYNNFILFLKFKIFVYKKERSSIKYIKKQIKDNKYFRTIDKNIILSKRDKENNSQYNESVERIDEFVELLHIIWSKPQYNQLRLGQLILNVVEQDKLYYMEDQELYQLLKRHYITRTRELKL